MLLLTGFILAIAFVVLALVVNSAIFTENLATRGEVPGSQDAIEYRDEVEQSVGSVLQTVNQDNEAGAVAAETGIEDISHYGGLDQSVLGRVVSVSHEETNDGTKLAQDAERNFTSNTTEPDWSLATDVEQSRHFQLHLTEIGIDGDTFSLILNESGTTWEMRVTEDGASDIAVEVEPPHGETRTCTRSFDDGLTVDVTAGTVGGKSCPGLTRASDGTSMWYGTGIDDEYDIRFEGGDAVEGTYSVILGDGNFQPPEAQHYGNEFEGAPYYTQAIYDVTVTYEYYTPDVGYETGITVAPGEVPA